MSLGYSFESVFLPCPSGPLNSFYGTNYPEVGTYGSQVGSLVTHGRPVTVRTPYGSRMSERTRECISMGLVIQNVPQLSTLINDGLWARGNVERVLTEPLRMPNRFSRAIEEKQKSIARGERTPTRDSIRRGGWVPVASCIRNIPRRGGWVPVPSGSRHSHGPRYTSLSSSVQSSRCSNDVGHRVPQPTLVEDGPDDADIAIAAHVREPQYQASRSEEPLGGQEEDQRNGQPMTKAQFYEFFKPLNDWRRWRVAEPDSEKAEPRASSREGVLPPQSNPSTAGIVWQEAVQEPAPLPYRDMQVIQDNPTHPA